MQTMQQRSGCWLEPRPPQARTAAEEAAKLVADPLHSHTREKALDKKGYWIAHVQITNPERYKDYIAANAAPLKKHGARFLVRNGECQVKGQLAGRRHVVIEFDSYATAKACHDSAEYQAAAKIRDEASDVELIIVEGYGG